MSKHQGANPGEWIDDEVQIVTGHAVQAINDRDVTIEELRVAGRATREETEELRASACAIIDALRTENKRLSETIADLRSELDSNDREFNKTMIKLREELDAK